MCIRDRISTVPAIAASFLFFASCKDSFFITSHSPSPVIIRSGFPYSFRTFCKRVLYVSRYTGQPIDCWRISSSLHRLQVLHQWISFLLPSLNLRGNSGSASDCLPRPIKLSLIHILYYMTGWDTPNDLPEHNFLKSPLIALSTIPQIQSLFH